MKSIKSKLCVKNLAKHYNRHVLFKKLSFELESGEIIAITGWNGTGKSTLLRIIAGLIRPSAGKVDFFQNDLLITDEKKRNYLGMVAPEISLYNELTAMENLSFFTQVRNLKLSHHSIINILEQVGLKDWCNELYGIFSSGMKQRLKLAQAILHQPSLLLFDEPFNNLDSKGIEMVDKILKNQKEQGMIIIASNDKREIEYADRIINLSE